MHEKKPWAARGWLVGLLLVACGLRGWAFPNRYHFDDVDEFYYLMGGPQVWEGLPPAYHYAFAGPETWVGWVYAAGLSARYLVWPTAEEAAVPVQVRPFLAVNHAMWDVYFDMSGLRVAYIALSMAGSIASVAAAFGYGRRRGGLPGAVLFGGLTAALPVLVAHAALAKPYAAAWACVPVAAYALARAADPPAGRTGRRWWWASAATMGLAVSSRVDMVGVLPVLLLLERWPRRLSPARFIGESVRFVLVAGLTVALVSPWAWTNLLGNLRAIATIRLVAPVAETTRAAVLADLLWTNAMGLPLAVLVVAVGVAAARRQAAAAAGWTWPAAVVVLLLATSFLSATGYGLRHQGPALMSVLLAMPTAAAAIVPRRAVWALVVTAVAVAGFQAARAIRDTNATYVPDGSTAWVNARVPPGTALYLTPSWRDPLPTPASADALWDEVMTRDAVRRKYEQGLSRLRLAGLEVPRALSEQIMTTERTSARRFYILGGRAARAGPRFAVRRYYSSAVFGLQDPAGEYVRTGGVLIWRGDGPAPGITDLPAARWTTAGGRGTYVYVSPELVGRLNPP